MMQKIISFLLIFCLIAVVNSQNCSNILSNNNCRQEFINFVDDVYLETIPTNINYAQLNQKISSYCSSTCKNTAVQYLQCEKDTNGLSFINNGLCAKINQDYCLVHHVRGTIAQTIPPVKTLDSPSICPSQNISGTIILTCTTGDSCHQKLQSGADYLMCCAGPFFNYFYELSDSCNITASVPCLPVTVFPTFSSTKAGGDTTGKATPTKPVGGVTPTKPVGGVTPTKPVGGVTTVGRVAPTKTVTPSGAIGGDSSLLVLITVIMIHVIVMLY